MKLAFYHGGESFFSNLIFLKQRLIDRLPLEESKYTHVEIVFTDGRWFSSRSSTDDKGYVKGVHFIDEPKDSSLYHFIKLEKIDEGKVREWCESQVGKKYGWWNIVFAQAFPFPVNTKFSDNFFCSAICKYAVKKGVLQVSKKYEPLVYGAEKFTSPGKLFQMMK